MIGVAQNNLSTGLIQQPGRQPFDRSTGADGHEGRQVNHTAWCRQSAQSRTAVFVLMQQFVFKSSFHSCQIVVVALDRGQPLKRCRLLVRLKQTSSFAILN